MIEVSLRYNSFDPGRLMGNSDHFFLSAAQHAQQGKFAEMLSFIEQAQAAEQSADLLLKAGNLCLEYGFVTKASDYFDQRLKLVPGDLAARAGLAKVATEVGDHVKASAIYDDLVARFADHEVLRRNALVALQYNPAVTDQYRYDQALAWGQWAIVRAGGFKSRPAMRALLGRAPRVGVVSADFCQHTVGLFVKDVMRELGSRWPVFAYSARGFEDWVSKTIKSTCTWRSVAELDDKRLAQLIESDEIDILIDLSGHTAGSRLTAFAHRPAPVMVSWLGYFATTGLPYIDAVLLDQWHAPHGVEKQFVEPIVRLPLGRFYFQPVKWAPSQVSEPPCLRHGHVTFGCFNNTAKLNPSVVNLWAKTLRAVPGSRLVLKWRTLNDEVFGQSLLAQFENLGVAPERVELRGPGFHADVLKEYADIDIALDPFPFTGGLTSCEALWMGVPVVTMPQATVVSRQTLAFVSSSGLIELAANDENDYVRIASQLAHDVERLKLLRSSLRDKLQASSLMNLTGFVDQLQQALLNVYQQALETMQ